MRRRVALLLATCLLASATAASTTTPHSNRLGISLIESASLPLVLTAGPEGTTTLNQHGTGAKTTVSGTFLGQTYNVTRVTNQLPASLEIRLVATSISGATSSCDECHVRLVQGATTTTQIAITAGTLLTTDGAWVDLLPTGDPADDWDIHLRANTNGLANEDATIHYRIELREQGETSPLLRFQNMTAVFIV